MGRGETESNDGRTPYPSAPDEMRKAGFYTFIPHAGSLASAEERQEQPASAGFFLLALSTGANLAWSTTNGVFKLKISALFVQGDGCYSDDDRIDPWPFDRDARTYDGCNPVIAHPPCQLWGKMAKINYKRWGGDHNKPGNDGGCFHSALQSVNRCGGVLEHPAGTYAWMEFGLDKPVRGKWVESGNGWVCEVWQSAYGHKANKATWLYYVGDSKPFDMIWDRPIGSHQIGHPDKMGKARNKPTLNKEEANATPEKFKEELIRLAIHSMAKI